MPLLASAICCCSSNAACVSPLLMSTLESSRPDLSSSSMPVLMTLTAMPLATPPALYPPMPSARTARPDSPSTNTESSLCVRTIPGWERLATSRGPCPLIVRPPPRQACRAVKNGCRLGPSAASLRCAERQGESRPRNGNEVANEWPARRARRFVDWNASRFLRRSTTPGKRPPHPDHQRQAHGRRERGKLRCVRGKPRCYPRILDHHFTGDIAKQAAPRQPQTGNARDQAHDDLASEHHDRNADDQSENDQRNVALGGSGDAHDVVEAHDQIGDDDGPNGGKQPVAGLDVVFAALPLGDQLYADPQQQRAADQLEVGIPKQVHREKSQHNAQDDRPEYATEDAVLALPPRQIAASECDHHRVVPRQQDIDQDDLQRRKPELRRTEFHHVI